MVIFAPTKLINTEHVQSHSGLCKSLLSKWWSWHSVKACTGLHFQGSLTVYIQYWLHCHPKSNQYLRSFNTLIVIHFIFYLQQVKQPEPNSSSQYVTLSGLEPATSYYGGSCLTHLAKRGQLSHKVTTGLFHNSTS